jgi:hypothetical protein
MSVVFTAHSILNQADDIVNALELSYKSPWHFIASA